MNKSFTILLVVVAIWGVSLGLAFIVGLTMGKAGPDVEALAVPVSIQTSPAQADEVVQFGPGQGEEPRRRIDSGDISQEDLDRFRQQFRDGSGQSGPDGGFRSRIESGDISQEDLDRFRQQFRDGSGQGGADGGGFRRGGFGDHADGENGDAFSGQHPTEEPTPQPSD
ncbi:MAG: hypothetical protein IIC83_09240 [Chloroflexi bacterium]|nr:hypothetical protein [Chloroflexota bacterium]